MYIYIYVCICVHSTYKGNKHYDPAMIQHFPISVSLRLFLLIIKKEQTSDGGDIIEAPMDEPLDDDLIWACRFTNSRSRSRYRYIYIYIHIHYIYIIYTYYIIYILYIYMYKIYILEPYFICCKPKNMLNWDCHCWLVLFMASHSRLPSRKASATDAESHAKESVQRSFLRNNHHARSMLTLASYGLFTLSTFLNWNKLDIYDCLCLHVYRENAHLCICLSIYLSSYLSIYLFICSRPLVHIPIISWPFESAPW